MIRIEGPTSELAKVEANVVAKPSGVMSIAQLEQACLSRFPAEDAEPWDRTGLLVGDPAELVRGVAVALDPTRAAIEQAAGAGANVLVTHHPAYLDPPDAFSPSYGIATAPGVNVYTAVRSGVALMNFHTALDVSMAATRLLPNLLSLDFERILVPIPGSTQKGYGQLCRIRSSDAPFKLAHLAARTHAVLGRPPRVWGDFSAPVERVVIANGSAGNVVEAALAAHVDCLVCGEIRYHSALDAHQAGLSIIELGHDVSELPLAALLAETIADIGIDRDRIVLLDQSANWSLPEATRV